MSAHVTIAVVSPPSGWCLRASRNVARVCAPQQGYVKRKEKTKILEENKAHVCTHALLIAGR